MEFALGFMNGNLPIVNNFGIFRFNKVSIGLINEQHESFLEYKTSPRSTTAFRAFLLETGY